jgi:hypothetical protein
MPAEEGVSNEVIVVVSGGAPPDPQAALAVPLGPRVIAADSGLDHALALGLEVEIAVGDFDSALRRQTRAEAGGRGRAPAEGATDLELARSALLWARILVLAGEGGGSPPLPHRRSAGRAGRVDALVGRARVHVRAACVPGAPGSSSRSRPSRSRGRVRPKGSRTRGETLAGSSRGVSTSSPQGCACRGRARGAAAIVPGAA